MRFPPKYSILQHGEKTYKPNPPSVLNTPSHWFHDGAAGGSRTLYGNPAEKSLRGTWLPHLHLSIINIWLCQPAGLDGSREHHPQAPPQYPGLKNRRHGGLQIKKARQGMRRKFQQG
jgi:hypothetical protein